MTTTTNRPTWVKSRAADRETDRTVNDIRRGLDQVPTKRQSVTTDGTGAWTDAFVSASYPPNTTVSVVGEVSGKPVTPGAAWLATSIRAAFVLDNTGAIAIHDATVIFFSNNGTGYTGGAQFVTRGTNQLALQVIDDGGGDPWKFTTVIQLFEVT